MLDFTSESLLKVAASEFTLLIETSGSWLVLESELDEIEGRVPTKDSERVADCVLLGRTEEVGGPNDDLLDLSSVVGEFGALVSSEELALYCPDDVSSESNIELEKDW